MRKIITCLAVFLALSATSKAQTKIGFGLGYHQSGVAPAGGNYTFGTKSSFDMTVLLEIPVKGPFYLQSGISLLDKSFDLTYIPSGASSAVQYSFTPVTLELPVNLLLKPTFKRFHPFIGAGAFVSTGIAGSVSTDAYTVTDSVYSTDSHKIRYGSNKDNSDLKKYNLGYRALAGIALDKNLRVSVSYSSTFTNIFPSGATIASISSILPSNETLSGKSQIVMCTLGITL